MRSGRELTGWILAMASLAMMVGVRAVHSPLVHMLGTCGHQHCHVDRQSETAETSVCQSSSCATHPVQKSTCGHSHHVAQNSDVQDPADHAETDSLPVSEHHHSDDCQLCQYLTQCAQPVPPPVALVGQEMVTERPVSEVPCVRSLTLPGPYVRGPPLHVS